MAAQQLLPFLGCQERALFQIAVELPWSYMSRNDAQKLAVAGVVYKLLDVAHQQTLP